MATDSLDTFPPAMSCNCMTKTPDPNYHRPGCPVYEWHLKNSNEIKPLTIGDIVLFLEYNEECYIKATTATGRIWVASEAGSKVDKWCYPNEVQLKRKRT